MSERGKGHSAPKLRALPSLAGSPLPASQAERCVKKGVLGSWQKGAKKGEEEEGRHCWILTGDEIGFLHTCLPALDTPRPVPDIR